MTKTDGSMFKSRGLRGWKRWLLQLVFLLSFGFTGGVLYLLFFLVPFEQWLTDRETAQGVVDLILGALVLLWGVIGLCATAFFGYLFLSRRRDVPVGIGVIVLTILSSFATFYFLLDTDLMVALGEMNDQNVQSERFTYGAYPDERKLEQLKDEGYDGVITLLNPDIPFERVLLDKELANGKSIGLSIHSYPMLPWISQNEKALREIKGLVTDDTKRYYVHCYLGKHRVDYVRQALSAAGPVTAPKELEPLPKAFERGRLVAFDDEKVVLGPYPTEEEWFNFVVRRNAKEVVSTLNPEDPGDAPWVEEEKRIAKQNGLTLTLKPLDAQSPDPKAVQDVVAYVRGRKEKVYLHDFLESERFNALDAALRETEPKRAPADDVASRPASPAARSPKP